jgi:lipopolysaccharide heptosyltransferase II
MTSRRWLRRQAIALALAIVGALLTVLVACLDRWRRPAGEIRRILVIRLDLLGDVVLSLPAVLSLRAAYPDAEITMLVRPAAREIAERCPAVDRVKVFDVDGLRPSGRPLAAATWRDLIETSLSIRRGRFDLVVGLFGFWAAWFAGVSGAPRRIGYRSEAFHGAYTRPVSGRRYHPVAHETAYCLRLARAAGGSGAPRAPALAPGAEDRARASSLLANRGFDGRPLVVVNAGSAAGDAKRWTPEGWTALIDRLQARGVAVALVGSTGDASLAKRIAAACGRAPMVLAGQTSVGELIGVLDQAAVVVSGDSGPLHLAAALRRPVVAIHGPSDPRISGPTGTCSRVVRLALSCSPCYDGSYAAQCPLGHHRCMRELTSDQVERAVLSLLPIRRTIR